MSLPLIEGLELANITANPGLLDSTLGRAKIVNGHHVLTHFYDLTALTNKTLELWKNYQQTITRLSDDPQLLDSTKLLTMTINATYRLIDRKLNDIRVPMRETRVKRGLINGLGSVVKFITGNLDHEDELRYNSIVNHLQKNQEDLLTQIQHQYSINEAVQANFNRTIDLISKNNLELAEEINYLSTQVHLNNRRSESKALFEHYQIVLNIILDTVQDIESSLVACRSNSLHPSVVDSYLLAQELSKLSNHYGDRLLNFRGQNLFEIQSHIKVKCYIGVDEIVYFLNIPIVDPRDFEIHVIEPIPTFVAQEFLTIIPAAKRFLKHQNDVYPLTQDCPASHIYMCPNYFISPSDFPCESNFLKTGSTKNCKFIKLVAETNSIKLLYEINSYLAFFPKSDTLSFVHPSSVQTRTLQGIYLISPGNQTIKYKNQTLFAPHNEIAGKPTIISDLSFTLESWQTPERELKLNDLELISLELPQIQKIKKFDVSQFIQPSFWTLFLYLVLATLFCFTFYHYHHHVKVSSTA